MKPHTMIAVALGTLAATMSSKAANESSSLVKERCLDPELTQDQAHERNTWAWKCGYIHEDDFDFLVRKRGYVVFVEPDVPTTASTGCIPDLTPLGFCTHLGSVLMPYPNQTRQDDRRHGP